MEVPSGWALRRGVKLNFHRRLVDETVSFVLEQGRYLIQTQQGERQPVRVKVRLAGVHGLVKTYFPKNLVAASKLQAPEGWHAASFKLKTGKYWAPPNEIQTPGWLGDRDLCTSRVMGSTFFRMKIGKRRRKTLVRQKYHWGHVYWPRSCRHESRTDFW